MKHWSASRLIWLIAMCALSWGIVALVCAGVGSTGFHWPGASEFAFRRDRVIGASMVGAALAAAGVAYQAVLRNPLADPYLLGASSGAALSAYLWTLPRFTSLLLGAGLLATAQESFAFAGAMLSVALVLAVAARQGGRAALDPVTLLLVGVIVNAINGSLLLLANALHRNNPGSGGETSLLVGGIRDVARVQLFVAGAIILLAWVGLLYCAGWLHVAMLGEAEARALGVPVKRLRWIALALASLMTAAAVAISGPIAFVGLICPHAARRVVGHDVRKLLPVATAAGAILLCLADALSRALAQENYLGTQLQVGILTGLLGGPFFLVLLRQKRVRS